MQSFDNAEILCDTNFIGVRIPTCAFQNEHIQKAYLGYNSDGVHDEKCSGVVKGDWQFYDGLELFDECGTNKFENKTHIQYTNNVGGKVK